MNQFKSGVSSSWEVPALSSEGVDRGSLFLCMIHKTPSLNPLPNSHSALPSAAAPDTCSQLYRAEVTPGVGALGKAHFIRFDLKSWELATLARDLCKSNVLFMTHLVSVVSFILSNKKKIYKKGENQPLSLIILLQLIVFGGVVVINAKNAVFSMLRHI